MHASPSVKDEEIGYFSSYFYGMHSNAVYLLTLSSYINEIVAVALRQVMKDGRIEEDERLTNVSLGTPREISDI